MSSLTVGTSPVQGTASALKPVPALLVLEDGTTARGSGFGHTGDVIAEAVFCTAMTGYQETLTDPSYCGQAIIMTAPHIGNTGWNTQDDESDQIWASALIVRDLSRRVSNWRATTSLAAECERQQVVGISGVDTRMLTRHLRERGVMRVGVFSGDEASRPVHELVERVQAAPRMQGASFADQVSCSQTYTVEPEGEPRGTVVALDLGIKAMTPKLLAERGYRVHVVPASSSADDIYALNPDGVFVSNGPGDPGAMDAQVEIVREVLRRGTPFFGICFGQQMFGRALGLDTYKLSYGHRGINQPVRDKDSGRVSITAQNHGFAVKSEQDTFDTPFGPGEVTHRSLNDGVVEGLRLTGAPAFSVQFHPEAAAGPHDAAYLFDRFADLMEGSK